MFGIHKAISIAGSQSELARRLGVQPQAGQQWAQTNKPPAHRVPQIIRVIGGELTYHDLRPDVFPEDGAA